MSRFGDFGVSLLGGGSETIWTPATLPALSSFSGSWANNTLRQSVESGLIPGNGSKVRFSFRGHSSEGISINKCYIGLKGTGQFDFASTPTQVFFGGSASVVIPTSTTQFCDPVNFSVTTSDNIIISLFVPSGASSTDTFAVGGSNSLSPYDSVFKAGDDATTLVASGYSSWGGSTYMMVLDDFEVGN